MAFLFCAVALAVALASYSSQDPSFNHVVSHGYQVKNTMGLVGAYAADLLVVLVGIGSWLVPMAFAALAAGNFLPRFFPAWWRWLGGFLLLLCVMTLGASEWGRAHASILEVAGGGLFGQILFIQARFFLRPTGAGLLWLFTLIVSFQLLMGLTWGMLFKRIRGRFLDLGFMLRERQAQKQRRDVLPREASTKDRKTESTPEEDSGFLRLGSRKAKTPSAMPKARSPRGALTTKIPTPGEAAAAGSGPPPFDFLKPPTNDGPSIPQKVLDEQARRLEVCLTDFGIQGEVQGATPGPVVTMYEYKPAPGVKISRIAGLSDDLALALRASAVRIEAPLAGRDTVGLEIPNDVRETVYLREIIESDQFQDSKSLLTLALGKDIHGTPYVADLAKMPHLLVAGATGQGKSVCINSLLLSFLYKASPDEVKLLLVDPKRIELALYSDLPHLVHPVVTDMALAKNALDWAVYEMEQRYDAMARLGVRNIEGYNKKLKSFGDKRPDEFIDLAPLPFLVIVIDELADLMLTARKEVETSIVRLAQLARASGIHMILATQRPSVDVVTGLIKANFPSRVAFTVTSPQDSRTIIDSVGANHLLGKGDMLFKPAGGKTLRLHGALVDEDEIGQVIKYWKAHTSQNFSLDFGDWSREEQLGGGANGTSGEGEGIPDDPIYAEAVQFVMEQGKASISLIQRRFRIGFNRAARFVEQMEQDGIVSPADGSKPRQVIGGRG
ncbi:MAG: DNA translocase FtsK 4TM domain-containing protein [Proteobacteria bacterium]|nr:DNA translocase FtsK 4TM domain-containing protein [Pseudomonadota bacterium]